MSWIDAELAEFGRRIGLPSLQLSPAGTCQLRLESGDHLAVDALEETVVVYRRHPLPWPTLSVLLQALRQCNPRAGGQAVQIGLRGQAAEAELVIAIRLPAREFTAQRLEQSWERIERWLEQVEVVSR